MCVNFACDLWYTCRLSYHIVSLKWTWSKQLWHQSLTLINTYAVLLTQLIFSSMISCYLLWMFERHGNLKQLLFPSSKLKFLSFKSQANDWKTKHSSSVGRDHNTHACFKFTLVVNFCNFKMLVSQEPHRGIEWKYYQNSKFNFSFYVSKLLSCVVIPLNSHEIRKKSTCKLQLFEAIISGIDLHLSTHLKDTC